MPLRIISVNKKKERLLKIDMAKKIQFSLIYRDMWQSSGKFQPRKDQLVRIAPIFVEMGCFARVETNGGAFEQVNLLAGENPNESVRAYTKILHDAGIQTHMLDRGLNALRMYPVPDDVRALMYKVKHAQGVDIPQYLRWFERYSQHCAFYKVGKRGGYDTTGGTLHYDFAMSILWNTTANSPIRKLKQVLKKSV